MAASASASSRQGEAVPRPVPDCDKTAHAFDVRLPDWRRSLSIN
jgi:hypothetical protein